MKLKHLLLTACLCLLAGTIHAQTVCRIKYDYDAAGNRVKRSYACESMTDLATQPVGTTSVLTNLYPNPTTGPLTGIFSQPVGGNDGAAYVSLSSVAGVLLLQMGITQPSSSFSINISQQLPGTYILNVAAFGQMDTYTITKL